MHKSNQAVWIKIMQYRSIRFYSGNETTYAWKFSHWSVPLLIIYRINFNQIWQSLCCGEISLNIEFIIIWYSYNYNELTFAIFPETNCYFKNCKTLLWSACIFKYKPHLTVPSFLFVYHEHLSSITVYSLNFVEHCTENH